MVGLAVLVAVAVLLGGMRLAAGRRRMLHLAQVGAQASAEPVGPEALTPRQQELLVQVGRLGFATEPACRVRLGDQAPTVYANARSADGTTWFRSAAIEGIEHSSLSLLSHYPGGRLVSASDAHHAVDPREVVQCVPDPAPGRLLAQHQEAMAALAGLGAHPVPLAGSLTRLVEEEWHDEARLMREMGPLAQVALSRRFWTPPRPTPPVAGRADLAAVARMLAGSPGG